MSARGTAETWGLILGASLAPALFVAASDAIAQTNLPEVTVTTRPLEAPKTKRARAAPPVAAQPAPPATVRPLADDVASRDDKAPVSTHVLTSADLDRRRGTTLLEVLEQGLPGVWLGDQAGNPFQRDLDYRGFRASPVPGTPQGLAVYQNGIRINESFGEVVNWDFIPEMAIKRLALTSANPVFGLNAIAGALTFDMKNGFTDPGNSVEAELGSYGRRKLAAQSGWQHGNLAGYVAADAIDDDGWRRFSSSSQLRRLYVDLGARDLATEWHVNFTGADNRLGGTAATPLDLLNQDWASVYTWPQTTHQRLAFLTTSLDTRVSDTLTLQANAYYRGYWRTHTDGNGTDAQLCDPGGALAGQLCIGDGATAINRDGPVFDTLAPGAFLGEIDRSSTATNSFGGTAQAVLDGNLFDRGNRMIVGLSLDHGRTAFSAASELGTVDQNLFVGGTGIAIDQPASDVTPVNLLATNTYAGLYATDTLDVTARLAVTAGARFNVAQIDLADRTGVNPELAGRNRYQRLNPMIGTTYRLAPALTAYASYSEANRAPTPLELGCASPTTPCTIDNFLIADPPLRQVVARTIEGGLRGHFAPQANSDLVWAVSVFRTGLTDDIIDVASAVPGFGYFQNAGDTLRQGLDAGISYRRQWFAAYANYAFVDATYQSALTISSPNNPAADANGNIFVRPGDRIPGIPAHRFKVGTDLDVTGAWKIGADLTLVGSQYLLHDDANQNPRVPPYAVVNLHTAYRLTPTVELFGRVNNLFNTRYYTAGTFVSTSGFNSNTFGAPNFLTLNDPRAFIPGMPLAVYAGLRATF
jgi:iron complex outermembrane recepter protein